jgi:hypothetical protein
MLNLNPNLLLLVPLAFAETFLIWALWQLHKQMRHRR